MNDSDRHFLRRAMRLAMNGRGSVEPNPMVGCVLVKNGQITGEGWHGKFGGPHAEPTALNDCRAKGNDPSGATAYVTLEPCCHTNKQTPPCAPRLIEAKIARVVIGCLDPNPDVNGKGVTMLRAAGIEVELLPNKGGTSVPPVKFESRAGRTCYEELDGSHFQQLIAPFITCQIRRSTYRTLKWAETADGKVSGPKRGRLQISNERSTRIVHDLRGRCDAIVVGIGTVLQDDPLLTPRLSVLARRPHRYVFDSRLRLPVDSQLVRTAREVPTTVIADVRHRNDRKFQERAATLRSAGVIVDDDVASRPDGLDLYEAIEMGSLRQEKTHVLFECGPTLGRAILPLVHRLWVIRSSTVRSPQGIDALDVPDDFVPTGTLDLAGDTLTEYLNTQSPAFFAAVPSADLVLAAGACA